MRLKKQPRNSRIKGRIIPGRFIPERYREAFLGDIQEIFELRTKGGSRIRRLKLHCQILSSLFSLWKKNLSGSVVMYKNYFLMAFRNLRKHRAYTLVNILGLSLGLSAVMLILFYLQFELSYDRFHIKGDSIYRVSIRHLQEGRMEYDDHIFTPPIGPDMQKTFPEVEDFVRMTEPNAVHLNVGEEAFKLENIRYASEGFFRVFSFPLIMGDPQKALADPFSIVLSQRTAARLFGSRDPIGKIIQIGPEHLYRVTGVVENHPQNSSIQFNALISFATFYSLPGRHMGWNGGNQYITYIQLGANADPVLLETKFPEFLWEPINKRIADAGWKYQAYLQPLTKIHFYFDRSSRTALMNFYTFTVVAVLILLTAVINFVNLTTARAARRAREVGLRKVMGACRGNLIRQFLGESLVMTAAAFLLGIGLVFLLTPTYNQLLGKDLNFFKLLSPIGLLGMAALILVVGIASGIHPAFHLSSFQPVKTLKSAFDSGSKRKKFRNSLVIFQFAISVTLIVSTYLIQNQLRFMKKLELGYDRNNMLILPLYEEDTRRKTEDMRAELLKIPGIIQASASSEVPYGGFTGNGYRPQGFSQSIMIRALAVDEHFFETYNVPIIRGRNFSKEFSTDQEAYLINETLAVQLGWDDPIGKTIFRREECEVIGLVKDFQFSSLYNQTEPLIITNSPYSDGYGFEYLSIKVGPGNLSHVIESVGTIHKQFSPRIPFEYFFLDEAFNRLYKSEERFERIFQYFSFLAVCIALLGLFSLSAYSVQQRAKEIGIRKILGASVPSILSLVSREMMALIIAANILAVPAVLFIINRWMMKFAYRNLISPVPFVLALTGSLAAAFLTISFQSMKAAVKKPVDELRSE